MVAWVELCMLVRVVGLITYDVGVVVEMEAGVSFKADVVLGIGSLAVGAEGVLDAPKIFVDAEQQIAGPLAFKEYATGWHILLKLLDVVQDVMPYLGIPVVVGRGVWAAEGEELLEDAECGSSSCCRCGGGFWGRERVPAGGVTAVAC
ncbi:hypothetical protein HGM15179_020595 [Zosterops borbonicus]|uniref:Uncharacterized protein n=1 Tax=Zosterops borbonicus TaxID=364589 RepID=A0A8K1D7N7_9PASS|nr:hypothetical protein HGM15179_020595 [Zosterops borbonicus]